MTCADCGALVPDDYHDHDLERFCPGCCPKCRQDAIDAQRVAARSYAIARIAIDIADTPAVVRMVQRSAAERSRLARTLAGVPS